MSNVTLETLNEKIDALALRVGDLEAFTESTHNRISDIENLRESLRRLESEFVAERTRVASEIHRAQSIIRENVLEALAKVTGEQIASALRDDIVAALKSTILVTRSASAQEIRQAR